MLSTTTVIVAKNTQNVLFLRIPTYFWEEELQKVGTGDGLPGRIAARVTRIHQEAATRKREDPSAAKDVSIQAHVVDGSAAANRIVRLGSKSRTQVGIQLKTRQCPCNLCLVTRLPVSQ